MLTGERRVGGRTAEQEVEVWCLAVHSNVLGVAWRDVRAEEHAKEVHFEPFAKRRGVLNSPGRGREILGREAAAEYKRLRVMCPELQDIERVLLGQNANP